MAMEIWQENQRLRRENQRLRQERDDARKETNDMFFSWTERWNDEHGKAEIELCQAQQERDELAAQVLVLREALRFYAEHLNYRPYRMEANGTVGDGAMQSDAERDCGKRARAALKAAA